MLSSPANQCFLSLSPERTHMKPSRVAERCHESLDFRSSDLDPALDLKYISASTSIEDCSHHRTGTSHRRAFFWS